MKGQSKSIPGTPNIHQQGDILRRNALNSLERVKTIEQEKLESGEYHYVESRDQFGKLCGKKLVKKTIC